ncbi:type II and III secretion system protein family protein [Novosphingobium sp. 9]|uniref:type II and III secretion system protein family protein n=1 Tax=Novosphingobium sp. 9 TaxID=2025349 RepID=UPI0021B63CB4|nr:type II and III secretion system protein family protein [Novosphingobium sp. 9]
MKSHLIKSLLISACVLAPLGLGMASAAPANAQAVTKPAHDIALSIGNGELITVPGTMNDVFVANDAVADVQVKSKSQLYVFGKAGGTTTVYASNAAGAVVWSATVRVGSNIDSVDQMLRLAMPEAQIAVSTIGSSTVLLTGTVRQPEDAAEAERLVTAYMGKDSNVISRLRVATPLQVNLQVRIAEVTRSLVRSLGVNLSTVSKGGNGFQFGVGQGSVTSFTPGSTLTVGSTTASSGSSVTATTAGTTIAGAGKLLGLNILAALDAGETVGLVHTLAQPNLTALSGETADFLAGGEYPIPVSQGSSGGTSVTIQYKNYGVSLAYTPTVLANGRISLRVRPEVSELSSDGEVTLNGYSVPALTVRRTETTVELGSGQSFMIAGLLSTSEQNSIQKMPGAGDIPVLGSLFRSTSYQRGETELVIVVTPYLVNPVTGAQIALPTDGFQSANELQQILGNAAHDGQSSAPRTGATMAPDNASASPGVGQADTAMPAATAAKKRSTSADDAAAARPGFGSN